MSTSFTLYLNVETDLLSNQIETNTYKKSDTLMKIVFHYDSML